MAFLSPSLILLTYRSEKGSFVLENDSDLPLTVDSAVIPRQVRPEYLNRWNEKLPDVEPGVLADVAERIQHDFRGYALYTSWYTKRRYHVVIRHNKNEAKFQDYVKDCDMKALGTGRKSSDSWGFSDD